jgi:H+/Cl- antiporter ClcA
MFAKSYRSSLETLVQGADLRIKLVVQGVLIGLLSGLVVVLYRFLLGVTRGWGQSFYQAISGRPLMIFGGLFFLVFIGLGIGLIIKKEPLISGSGIPQIEGMFHGKMDMNCWHVILGKLFGGVITLGAGLSLGRENHQIGASVALWVSRVLNRLKTEEKYLITAGASAGLAAAFNTPVAGVIFALEQVHRHFSPLVLLSASTAAITADIISKGFFGEASFFALPPIASLPLKHSLLLVGLGITLGVLGVLFNHLLAYSSTFYQRRKWLPDYIRPVLPFIAAGLFALFFPYVVGDHRLVVSAIIDTRMMLALVFAILAVKFLFTIFCYGSGVPGGIIVPLLALGALAGNVYGQGVTQALNLNPELVNSITVVGMVGMFAAVIRAPITGTVLVAEMTGSVAHFPALALVAITAYVTAELFKLKLDYESWLARLFAVSEFEAGNSTSANNKVLLEIAVSLGSVFDGKAIKDCEMPTQCLLVNILRGGEELIPRGDTIVRSGDILTVLTPERHANYVKEQLNQKGQFSAQSGTVR